MWGRCWQDGREGLKLRERISRVAVVVAQGLRRIMCYYSLFRKNAIIILPESLTATAP